MDKMREDFEEFASGHSYLKQFGFDKNPFDGFEYDAIPLQASFEVWQASRKAIVINLPGWDDFDTTRQVISAVKDEIEQEGITVKQ